MGCTRATRGACNNKVLLRPDLAEQVIFDRLREQVVENDKLNVLFDKVKKEVLRLLNQSSRQLPSKTSALAKEQARLDNFVRFISEGNSSEAIAEALQLSERRVADLRDEIALLQAPKQDRVMPSQEWVASQLAKLKELLSRRSGASSQLLQQLLKSIEMKPVRPPAGLSTWPRQNLWPCRL